MANKSNNFPASSIEPGMIDRLEGMMSLRNLVCAIVAFVFLGSAFAASAQDEVPSLEGTKWVGADGPEENNKITTFFFEKGGILSYAYSGNSYRNGTWTQDGDIVSVEMNNGYRVFFARVKGDQIIGESKNVLGKEWTTTLYRFLRPNCDAESTEIAVPCKPRRNKMKDKGK